jgi:hypothetical protein
MVTPLIKPNKLVIPKVSSTEKSMKQLGFFIDMPMSDYQSHLALSRSGVVDLLESPSNFWYRHLSKRVRPPEPEYLLLGTLVNDIVLYDQRWIDSHYLVKIAGNTTVQQELASGRTLVNQKLWDEAHYLADSINENTLAHQLIHDEGAIPEPSIFFEELADNDNPSSIVQVKARPDVVNIEKRYFADIKTIADMERWSSHAIDLGYHIQNVMSHYGLQRAKNLSDTEMEDFIFYFIVVDKGTGITHVKVLDDWYLNKGVSDFNKALLLYHQCSVNNNWHTVTSTTPPRWAIHKEEA